MHVVVVDLLRKIGRSDRTDVEVESDKDERTFVLVTVGTDELTLTEAHVRLKTQDHACASAGVCSDPAAANVCQPHEPVEVRDLGWIIEAGQCIRGIKRIMVGEDPEGSNWPVAPRDRVWLAIILAIILIIIVVVGTSRLRTPDTGA